MQFDFDALFASFSNIKVGVLGDVMLDTYIWGKVERISPEAPVPVVSLKSREHRIGGAGNVALNLRSLQVPVHVLSVLGDDEDGLRMQDLFVAAGINTNYLVHSDARPTTNKTRIISRNQQMMRLDSETTRDLAANDEAALLQKIQLYIQEVQPNIIILEDYNKGVLTENVIAKTIALCQQHGILTAVDPKKKNFFAYQQVDIFKPNLKEIREGLNIIEESVSIDQLKMMHALLQEKLQHQISFITLSEHGVFYQQGNELAKLPAHLRNIADVSGAGDTVIAVASLVYAATKNLFLMAEIANIAGGLVCEQVGTAAIDKALLLQECKALVKS
jgi:D-glycero-beta-D-manno-heptose-7-phosphate kinase